MKNIKKIVRSDAAFDILDNSSCAGTDWGAGGCAILAQAINKLEGYPMVVIYNLDYDGPEHFGVMTPDGNIIDHDGTHRNSKAWLRFFLENEHPREGALTVKYFTPDMNMNGIKFDDKAATELAELIRQQSAIREMVHEVVGELQEDIFREFDEYLSEVFSVRESDEPSPTFEWDIAKDKIDRSKSGVKTAEQAYDYLKRFIEKVKNLPEAIKKRLIRYVAVSFIALLGLNVTSSLIPSGLEDVKHDIEVTAHQKGYGDELGGVYGVEKKEVHVNPRKSSSSLVDFLKYEEGSIKHKGEPVLKAYKLGDGMITVGWGHAEKIGASKLRKGDTITVAQAEALLKEDIEEAELYLNNILDDWKEQGIEVTIDQGMYDAMTSMIFNMGIGNFKKSDFIQLVKQGKNDEAAEKILTTNVTYPGHVPRREKESEMFSGGTQLAMNEVRKIIRQVLREL